MGTSREGRCSDSTRHAALACHPPSPSPALGRLHVRSHPSESAPRASLTTAARLNTRRHVFSPITYAVADLRITQDGLFTLVAGIPRGEMCGTGPDMVAALSDGQIKAPSDCKWDSRGIVAVNIRVRAPDMPQVEDIRSGKDPRNVSSSAISYEASILAILAALTASVLASEVFCG